MRRSVAVANAHGVDAASGDGRAARAADARMAGGAHRPQVASRAAAGGARTRARHLPVARLKSRSSVGSRRADAFAACARGQAARVPCRQGVRPPSTRIRSALYDVLTCQVDVFYF